MKTRVRRTTGGRPAHTSTTAKLASSPLPPSFVSDSRAPGLLPRAQLTYRLPQSRASSCDSPIQRRRGPSSLRARRAAISAVRVVTMPAAISGHFAGSWRGAWATLSSAWQTATRDGTYWQPAKGKREAWRPMRGGRCKKKTKCEYSNVSAHATETRGRKGTFCLLLPPFRTRVLFISRGCWRGELH